MNQYQFLKQLGQIPTPGGDGIRVTKFVDPTTVRTAAGLVLDASTTNPRAVITETNALAINAVASSNVLGTFVFEVPKDYDTVSDELKINLLAVSGGTTDVPTLNATAYRKRGGAALTAALTSVASVAIPTTTVKAAERTIDLSKNGLQPGDILTINLTSGAHTTDTVILHGIEMQYKGSIVFSVFNNRF
jgi:hypothetical protein